MKKYHHNQLNTAMKKLMLTLFFAISAFVVHAEKYTQQGDSLIVQFGNNTRLIIQAKDKDGILSLRQYDLNKIVRDMGAALDSSDKETYIYINEQNGRKYLKDTVLVISRKDGEVKITINGVVHRTFPRQQSKGLCRRCVCQHIRADAYAAH